MTLAGFVESTHLLSTRSAFARLQPIVRTLVNMEPSSLWMQDTETLPRPLRKYRLELRQFADAWLRPRSVAGDLAQDDDLAGQVLAEAGRRGYLSDFLPKPLGSLPLSAARFPLTLLQSIKMEELAAACGGFALLIGAHALGAAPLVFGGGIKGVSRFLLPAYRKSLAGTPHLFAFAITEPGGGSDVEDGEGALTLKPGVKARRTQGGWLLNGRKVFISGGDIASAVAVFAALENEGVESWTCFLVEKGKPGFSSPRKEMKMGQRVSSAAELLFEDSFVPDDHVIGDLRSGWAINRAVLNTSRIPVGAIATGIARGALESATEFARQNRLAGKRLLDYQDVQLTIAQMMIDVAAMRAMLWQSST
jgi:alkylation response protein AidB-like acyl-CoA dehydrogenase